MIGRLILASIIVFVIWNCFYFCKFSGTFSSNQSDWGDFSDYVSAITGIISSIFLIVLTFQIHKESKSVQLKLEKPVLTFSFNAKTRHYYCTNIGKGSAINVVIINKFKEVDNFYSEAVHCFSLPTNDKIDIEWVKGTAEFVVLYNDVFNSLHGTRFIHNKTEEIFFKSGTYDIPIFTEDGKINNLFGKEVKENNRLYDKMKN